MSFIGISTRSKCLLTHETKKIECNKVLKTVASRDNDPLTSLKSYVQILYFCFCFSFLFFYNFTKKVFKL